MADKKLTPAQERQQIKREWAAKLRRNGHILAWKFQRGVVADRFSQYIGTCKHCPGRIEVAGSGASTYGFGWTGNKRCPGKRRR